jgi:hypothetical protein
MRAVGGLPSAALLVEAPLARGSPRGQRPEVSAEPWGGGPAPLTLADDDRRTMGESPPGPSELPRAWAFAVGSG